MRAIIGKDHRATRLVQHGRICGRRRSDAQILDGTENPFAILVVSAVGLDEDFDSHAALQN
jgi:hypothetical protein